MMQLKKSLALLLAFAVLFAVPAFAAGAADKPAQVLYTRLADMDENGKLDAADARAVLRLSVGLDEPRRPEWLQEG